MLSLLLAADRVKMMTLMIGMTVTDMVHTSHLESGCFKQPLSSH